MTDEIWNIIETCWKANPRDRLFAKDVIERLLLRLGQQLRVSDSDTVSFTHVAESADWRNFIGLPDASGTVEAEVSSLDDLDIAKVPHELKTEGGDWHAVYASTKTVHDIRLMHTLMHERCVFPTLGSYFSDLI